MCISEGLKVTINTVPRQGPFRIFQTVQFSCEVEPAQSEYLSYQWKTVEHVFGGPSHRGESFNTTFEEVNMRYCWYFCSVYASNGTVLGSANRLVEVHGKSILISITNQILK